MKSTDKPKLMIALAVLVLAGVLFAWQYGLFGGGASTVPQAAPDAPKPTGGGAHSVPGAKK